MTLRHKTYYPLPILAKEQVPFCRYCNILIGKLVQKVQSQAIKKTGNHGIGTTNPSAKLEVVGNINATGNVKLSSTGYIHSGGDVIIRLGTA